jgi:hypothetical protein
LRQWEHLDGQVFAAPTNQALTLPAGTTAVSIESEGGVCYYAINHTGAGVNSHGYMPDGGQRSIGSIANLNTMHVHAPAATRVHVQYFREA